MNTQNYFLLFLTAVINLTACSSLPKSKPLLNESTINQSNYIYIVSHGWHTGIIVPSDLIFLNIPELKNRFVNSKYIEFGWGDKGFYQSTEITTGLTIQAIFWPTDSVIHAVNIPNNIYRFFPDSKIERLCLGPSELETLVEFINDSFYKNNNSIVPLRNGIYGDSQFYMATGDYYLFNTCNKWTAKGLKSSGFNINPIFKLTSSSVMNYLVNSKTSNLNYSCKEQLYN